MGSQSMRFSSPPNQSAISRSADSTESEPWITLRPTSTARSPRMVPGLETSGLVSPIIKRHALTAPGPSQTMHITGPETM